MPEYIPTDHVIPCAFGHGNPLVDNGCYTCEGLDHRGESLIASNCPNALVRVPTVADWNALQLAHFGSKRDILNQVLAVLQHSADVTSRNDLVKATYTAAIQSIRKIHKAVTINVYDPNDPDSIALLPQVPTSEPTAVEDAQPAETDSDE